MANKLNEVKVGQRVEVIANICGNDFEIGEKVTVTRVGTIDVHAKGDSGKQWYLHTDEFKLIPQGRWKVGDKAITNGVNDCGHQFAKGTVVTVKQVDRDGNVDFVEDANGRGFYVDNDEIEPYTAPPAKRNNGFKLGDVIYLQNLCSFMELTAQSTVDLANESTAIRLATEDERRKHLGLPPVKKDDDIITINITVRRKTLREGVEILGKANKAYELYTKLDDINDEVNK